MNALDEFYMRRCVQLARCGIGSTSPNPAVGALIVCDGRIIGEGYHIRAGEPHAEVNAVRSVREQDKALLPQSTMYVTLEPCPMCAGALAWSQIGRVVYGASDPKRGFSMFSPSLMHPKTEVVSGVLAEDCSSLVTEFFRNKRR